MYAYLLTLLLLFSGFASVAQECSKRSVYFRSDKHNLKKQEKATIDSLLLDLDPETHYLIELYAYTDSSNTARYNYELSGRRNASVMNYIRSIRPENLVFLTKNLGEKTSGNLQENRRVDIFTYPVDDKDRVLVEGSMGMKAWISYRNFAGCGYCLAEKPTLDPYYLSDKGDEKVLNLEIKRDCPINQDYKCDTAVFRIPFAVFNGSPSKFNRTLYAYRYSNWHGVTENMKSDSLFRVTYDTLTNEYVIYYDCYNLYRRVILCGGFRPPCFDYQFVFPSDISPIKTSVAYSYKPEKHHFPKAFSQAGIPGTQTEMVPLPVPEYKKKFWYLRYSKTYALEKKCPSFVSIFSYGVRDGNLVFAQFELEELRSILLGGESIYYTDSTNDVNKHFFRLTVPDDLYRPLKYTNVRMKLKVPRKIASDSLGIYLEPYDFFIPVQKGKRNIYEAMLPEMEFDIAVYNDNKETVIPFPKIKKRYKKRKYVLKMSVQNRNMK